MLYFKNSELAYTHHVSVRTVRNWIEAAKQGKLDLDLHTHAGRQYVSNTARNLSTIERMVEDRKKFRPHRAVKTVTPKPEFYKLFNQAQIYDIVSNLEIHHELPRDYCYFDGGATHWDEYIERLSTEETPNLFNRTVKLLEINQHYLDDLLQQYRYVNVVDVGVGNALPAKNLLSHLSKTGKLRRYIALDISPEMLRIAKRNVHEWFGDDLQFEDYELDICKDHFANILAEDYIKPDSQKTANIILFLGGTINNFRKPDRALSIINESMGLDDILIHTHKLDTRASRKYFDFSKDSRRIAVPEQNRLLIDLLDIDESFYDVEMGYDDELQERYIRIRLKVALTVRFEFEQGHRLVQLNKDDTILLWRAYHMNALNVLHRLERNDFYTLQTSQPDDQEYILTVSRIKKD